MAGSILNGGSPYPANILLLVRHGIYIIENLFLEDLARDQVYEFLFIGLPLKIQGAAASPLRPVAIAPKAEQTEKKEV